MSCIQCNRRDPLRIYRKQDADMNRIWLDTITEYSTQCPDVIPVLQGTLDSDAGLWNNIMYSRYIHAYISEIASHLI